MTVAFGILALLISDVALPEMGVPSSPAIAPPAWQTTPTPSSPGRGYPSGPSSSFGGRSSTIVQPQMPIPYAPTDSNAEQAVYPMGSPTSQLNPSAGNTRNPLLDYPSLWRTPTTPPGGPQRNTLPPLQPFGSSTLGNPMTVQDFSSYSPYSAQPVGGSALDYRHEAAIHGGSLYGGSTNKPYSGYRPSRGVSPYMNLFRDDTDFGRIDNYNTLVRPRLQQQNENRQAAGQIRGLQGATRAQGSAIQHIGNRTGTVPRTTGQFFNNTQQYFPGAGR